VFELIKSGGWLMIPLILCSITTMGIVGERFWSLQRKKVLPPHLIPQIWQLAQNSQLNNSTIRQLRDNSPLGAVLAAGLVNRNHGREVMKTSIEESGRQVVHELERFLNTLGTIALISPLLGLLGTVTGIIQIFSAMGINGLGNPAMLASGIGVALITTAAGLTVAIPSVFFHRYFERLVDEYVLKMEEESLKLLDIIHGSREKDDEFSSK
jgi:biopolymer transport protein ExbB